MPTLTRSMLCSSIVSAIALNIRSCAVQILHYILRCHSNSHHSNSHHNNSNSIIFLSVMLTCSVVLHCIVCRRQITPEVFQGTIVTVTIATVITVTVTTVTVQVTSVQVVDRVDLTRTHWVQEGNQGTVVWKRHRLECRGSLTQPKTTPTVVTARTLASRLEPVRRTAGAVNQCLHWARTVDWSAVRMKVPGRDCWWTWMTAFECRLGKMTIYSQKCHQRQHTLTWSTVQTQVGWWVMIVTRNFLVPV